MLQGQQQVHSKHGSAVRSQMHPAHPGLPLLCPLSSVPLHRLTCAGFRPHRWRRHTVAHRHHTAAPHTPQCSADQTLLSYVAHGCEGWMHSPLDET